jgi:MFS transporter, YNFM family, putative membrane transport protein
MSHLPTSAFANAAAPLATDRRQTGNANRALFLGGFATFAMLHCVQPLLPLFSREFGVSPMQSSWVVSIATGALSICLLLASILSDRRGRKILMCVSLFASALSTIACALVGGFAELVVLRGVLGIVLAGLPAVAMTYLSEEIDPKSLGYSMGLYIAGTALGGMVGRIAAGILSDLFSWRLAMAVIGAVALLIAVEFTRSLPASTNFRRREQPLAEIIAGAAQHFRDGALLRLFAIGFILLGTFVSVYNYLGYRLLLPKFGLSHTAISLIFSLYVIGMFSSVLTGRLSDRLGRRRVLWIVVLVMLAGLLLTLTDVLALIVLGIALFTFGFFGGHSVASSWVGRRAKENRALASALYLFSYYLGASVIGSLSGGLWERAGWSGVVVALAACLLAALGLSVSLRKVPLVA